MDNETTTERSIPQVTVQKDYKKNIALGLMALSAAALIFSLETQSDGDSDNKVFDGDYGTGINALPTKYETSEQNSAISTGYARNVAKKVGEDITQFDENGNPVINNYYSANTTEQPGSDNPRQFASLEKKTTPKNNVSVAKPSYPKRNQYRTSGISNEDKWERRKTQSSIYDANGRRPTQQNGTQLAANGIENEMAMLSQLMGQGDEIRAALPSAGPGTSGRSGNQNTAFANRVKSQIVETAIAMPMGDLEYRITQGKMIPCTLESAVDSSLPGMIRCVVSQNVFGEQGRTILIPRGARIVGQYNSAVQNGQNRIFMFWSRIITSTYDINIGSTGTDRLGRSGSVGEVDSHFWTRFGNATLLSLLGAGTASYGSTGDTSNVSNAYRQAIAQSFANQATADLAANTTIAPTIHKDQGEKIMIMAAKDLDFSAALGGTR